MKPTTPAKRWKGIKHCQQNATRHGAYAAEVFSARAFLRTFACLLRRLETNAEERWGIGELPSTLAHRKPAR